MFTPAELAVIKYALEVKVEDFEQQVADFLYMEEHEPEHDWGHVLNDRIEFQLDIENMRSALAKIG